MWYAVHSIIKIETIKAIENVCVWENIHLINSSDEKVWDDAEAVSQSVIPKDQSDLTWNGEAALMTYEGIRKIVEIQSGKFNGLEITHNELVMSASQFDLYVSGDSAIVTITGDKVE